MKITKTKDGYNIKVNQFELDCLHLVSAFIGGSSRARFVFSGIKDSLLEQSRAFVGVKSENFLSCSVWRNFAEKCGVIYSEIGSVRLKEFQKLKKNCSFYYPKAGFRSCSTSQLKIDDFEKRELKDAYEDNGFLKGIDKTFKQFDLNKVKFLVWE